MKAGFTVKTQRRRDRVSSGNLLALPDTIRPDRANPTSNFWWFLFWQHWHDLHDLGSHRTDSQRGILCWGFREFRKRFRRKRSALFKSAQWHFQQDNAPVLNSILVTDYLTKMGFKTVPHPPYCPYLAPYDFCLFPKLRDCRYETIREMREVVTKVIDTLTQEDFHGTFMKLLERYNKCIAAGWDYFDGDLSFTCVLSIKVPIRKKSGN